MLVNHGTVGGKNLMTSYNHLTRFAVSSGRTVNKGDVIGYSGNTGLSGACHLHFEVYVNGSTIAPMSRRRCPGRGAPRASRPIRPGPRATAPEG